MPTIPPEQFVASDRANGADRRRPPTVRFIVSVAVAIAWVLLSLWLSLPWLADLGRLSHPLVALFVLTFIAYVPGFMNAFLMMSLVLRPERARITPDTWPAITVLIAAYQEEALIAATLRSIAGLEYRGEIEILLLDDGSTDGTAAAVEGCAPCSPR